MKDKKISEAQEVTNYLKDKCPEAFKNIEHVFTEYPSPSPPRKLNIRWTLSKWAVMEIDTSVFGKHIVYYTHREKNIRVPYTNSEFLFFFLKGYGYSLHLIKKVFILVPYFINKLLQVLKRLGKKI